LSFNRIKKLGVFSRPEKSIRFKEKRKIHMKKLILLVLVLVIFLSSCNPWKYTSEYDHEVDFNNYKTFGLLNWERQNDDQVSAETKQFILLAIKKELEHRGYTYQKQNADLQASIYIIVNEETSYSAYANQYAGYNGYGGVAVGVGVGSGGTAVGAYGYGIETYPFSAVQHDYNVGTFVIDLLDASKKKIVWQGLAQGRVAHEEPSQEIVQERVNSVFREFPVKRVKE
jgi:hypothetical protein